jgi:hypothetical protein
MTSLNTTASWVIVERKTGNSVCEIFSPTLAASVRPDYEAVPILGYLQRLNIKIKNEDAKT